jgi:hypothetical protein
MAALEYKVELGRVGGHGVLGFSQIQGFGLD